MPTHSLKHAGSCSLQCGHSYNHRITTSLKPKPTGLGKSMPDPSPTKPAARRYGGITAQERQSQRRDRLLSAAFDVFGTQGYSGATMRLICAQARLTERYFYECFDGLETIFRVVHEQLTKELVMLIVTSLPNDTSGDPVALARGGLRVFFEYIKADPRRARILLIDAMSMGLTNPQVADSRASWYADLLHQRLQARYGTLPADLEVKLVASGFLGLVIHTASVWAQHGFDTSVDSMVNHTAYGWAGLHQWLLSATVKPASS